MRHCRKLNIKTEKNLEKFNTHSIVKHHETQVDWTWEMEKLYFIEFYAHFWQDDRHFRCINYSNCKIKVSCKKVRKKVQYNRVSEQTFNNLQLFKKKTLKYKSSIELNCMTAPHFGLHLTTQKHWIQVRFRSPSLS